MGLALFLTRAIMRCRGFSFCSALGTAICLPYLCRSTAACHIRAQLAPWCTAVCQLVRVGGNLDSFFTNSYCQQMYQNHVKTFVNR